MKIKIFFFFYVVLVVFVLFTFSASYGTETNSKIILENINLSKEAGYYNVEIQLSQPVEYNCYYSKEAGGIVIDLFGSNIYVDSNFKFEDSLKDVNKIKIIFYPEENEKFKRVDFIFIQLKRKLKFSSKKENSTILVKLTPYENAIIKTAASKDEKRLKYDLRKEEKVYLPIDDKDGAISKPEVLVERLGPQNPEQMRPEYIISGIFGWEDWLEIGIANHKPLQVAQEQIELAQIRVREARRALFPAATLKFTDTVAETTTVNLLQRSYGLQIAQPIMYGGELGFKVNQAKVNLAIAKKEYERIKADYIYDVKKAYYNLLLQGLNLAERKSVLEEAEKTLKLARQQYKLGLITELEYLNIKSLYNEIRFQYLATKKDLSLAELTFKQALHIEQKDLNISIQPRLIFEPINVNLEKCQELAFKRRPELSINSLIVDFNDYNRKIAEAKNRFRVDLSAFYGKSAEAYETEPLNLANNWFIGFKVSKPFGTSTLTGSYTREEASETETTVEQRLGTSTYTVEMNLLDRMDLLSEKKSASVEYLRSFGELEKTKELILAEIEEPYNNYRKSLYQIYSLKRRMELQEERIDVVTIYWKVNRGSLSDVLESKLRLSDLKVAYNQALVNYYIGLSGLAKGCNVEKYTYLIEPADASYPSEFALSSQDLERSNELIYSGGLMGQVIAIGKDLNFVIINLGKKDGVKKGMKFGIYRSGDKLGEIEVASLKDNSSSCQIITSIPTKDTFRLGDIVK